MMEFAQRGGLQSILDHPVDFVKSSTPFGHTVVRPTASDASPTPALEKRARPEIVGDALPGPKKVLFPEGAVAGSWQKIMMCPPGLQNTGNTCFLNSVMQALMHIPGLVIYLLSGQHGHDCRLNNCVFCKLEEHTKKAYPAGGSKRGTTFRPPYTHNLKQIGKQFRPGRQEDAHEFLILLLDQLQQSSLHGQPKNLDHRSKETTVVHRLFGGHLRQQIICSKCKVPSNTYEATLVLSVDCLGTVEQGLSRLTAAENLIGKNKYRCEKCKTLQEARKQTTIFDAPDNLVVHLKRFQFASKSSKIAKPVTFGQTLDLGRFTAQGRPAAVYDLTGVVVHQGSGVSSGHYYAFAKGSNETWSEFNDSSVSQAGIERVLKQQAYMLFYTRNSSSLGEASTRRASLPVSARESRTPDNKRRVSAPTSLPSKLHSSEETFDQLTGGNFKKRKMSELQTSKNKKHRIFAQMRGKA